MSDELVKWTTLQFDIRQALITVRQQQLAVLASLVEDMEDSLESIEVVKQELLEKK